MVAKYMILFVGLAALCGYIFTWLARFVAPKIGLLDKPDGGRRKLHSRAMPLMGGAAIYLATVTTALACWGVAPGIIHTDPQFASRFVMLVVSAGLFCLVGLWDDRRPLRARHKFLWQVVASLPFVIWGRSIPSVDVFGTGIELGVIGLPLTVIWLVACANVVNLLDGLDGLATTVGLIAVCTLSVLFLVSGNLPETAICGILAGSLFGFLIHNWPPAKIFLGDAGSLLIGFLVGALSLETSFNKTSEFGPIIPLVLISVPIFDTFIAILRRKLNGKGIGEADRRHIHHRLQDRRFSRCQTLLTISGLCVVMAIASTVASVFQSDLIAAIPCALVLASLVVSRIFGHDELVLLIRRLQAVANEWKDAAKLPPERANRPDEAAGVDIELSKSTGVRIEKADDRLNTNTVKTKKRAA